MGKFRFRKRKQRQHVAREIPIRTMIPNLVTFMAAASGITSIRYSCQGEWNLAVIAIIIACVLDGLDGRVARMLRATSKFGAELDSLSDFVSFGVAPALLLYFWSMVGMTSASAAYPFRGVFWALALFHALCGAFRLARFNIMIEDGPKQPYWKHFFMGLPAPGGAGMVMTPLFWQLHTESNALQSPWVGGAMLLLCGVLMASRCPTISVKHLRVPAKFMAPALIFVMFVIGMLVSQFWLTLGVMSMLYLLSVPVCGVIYLRLRKQFDAKPPAPAPAAGAPAA